MGTYNLNLWFKSVLSNDQHLTFFQWGRGGTWGLCIYLNFDFNLEAVTFVMGLNKNSTGEHFLFD